MTRIFGIDPGYAIVGYAIIDIDGDATSVVDYGVIETSSDQKIQFRLDEIRKDLFNLLRQYNPNEVSIEKFYAGGMGNNSTTVGMGRGALFCAIGAAELELAEYTPNQIKAAITGDGKADKLAVQEAVAEELNLGKIPKPDDAADALAIALTHYWSRKL